MSERDKPVLWLDARKGPGVGGGAATAGGGGVLLTTPKHRLDGPEHLDALDTTDRDATTDHHGLLPKLSGVSGDYLDGATGAWTPLPTAASANLPWFYVEDPAYGAVGDDTTDDSDAIEAARDAAIAAGGGVLLFGPKTYKITRKITFDGTAENLHLLGTGNEYGPTVIHQATANTTAFEWTSSWSDASRTFQGSVRDMAIRGASSATTTCRGVYAKSNVNLDNVGITGFYDGLFWDDVTFYSRARGCFFTDQGHASIRMADTNNCTIDTCRMTGDPISASEIGPIAYGVHAVCGSPRGIANRIVNCSIEYFTADGIFLDGGFATEIVGNYFETQQSSSGHAHIRIGPTTSTVATRIESNYFQGDGTGGFDAIAMIAATNVAIRANKFGINSAIGISSTGSTSNVLLDSNHNSPAGTFSLPATSYTLDPANPPMSNPMTTAGDLIRGGTSGTPTRFAIGSNGQFLTVSGGALAWGAAASALDDLTDVIITSPAVADRLRFDGTNWRNSALIWRPMTTYDPTSGLWVPLVDGDGNAIMAEA